LTLSVSPQDTTTISNINYGTEQRAYHYDAMINNSHKPTNN